MGHTERGEQAQVMSAHASETVSTSPMLPFCLAINILRGCMLLLNHFGEILISDVDLSHKKRMVMLRFIRGY